LAAATFSFDRFLPILTSMMRTLTATRPDQSAGSADQARPGASADWKREAALAIGTMVAAVALLVPVLQLWRADWGVPFRYGGDANYHLSVAKGLIDTGGASSNPALGAPFAQVIHDMPLGGDRLHLILLRALGALTNDPAATVNLFFVLSFPMVAVVALLVFRRLRVTAAPAVVGALLYAFLPYHLHRGVNHLFLSGYYTVPIGVYLALRLLDGRAAEPLDRRRKLLWLAGCVLVGSGGVYYAPLSAVLIAVATVAAYARDRSRLILRAGGVTIALIMGALGLNLAPSVWYMHEHGANTAVARHPAESEYYGLKPAALVLPREDHRSPGLAEISANYRNSSPVPSEGGQALGLVAAGGLGYLLAIAALTLAGRRIIPSTHRDLSFLAVAAIATGTVGGLSALFAWFVTPEIRSWNRLCIYIGFMALAALGMLADRLRSHLRARGRHAGVFIALLAATLVVGLLDQTSSADVPDYQKLAVTYHSDASFVAAIEADLPAQAMVFQLPIRAFPELRAPADMSISDSFHPYIHSHDLRWSFGGVEGRTTADWQQPLVAQPADSLLPRVAALDFQGLVVDRFGYDDRAMELEAALRSELGAPIEVSPDARYSFFDLRPYADRLDQTLAPDAKQDLVRLTLNPTQIAWTGVDGYGNDPLDRVGTTQQTFAVTFNNPGAETRPVRFRLSIEGSVSSPPLLAEWPGGTRQEISLTDGRVIIDRVIEVAPGATRVAFSTQGRPISQVAAVAAERYNLRLSDPAIYELLPPGVPNGG
jgi:phosphoglycerol transferase